MNKMIIENYNSGSQAIFTTLKWDFWSSGHDCDKAKTPILFYVTMMQEMHQFEYIDSVLMMNDFQ